MLSPASSEYQVDPHVSRLDPVAAVEQAQSGDEEIELKKVEEALDDRHYGLERGEGAHHRVPRRAQAARRRSARADPLLRRPAGHRQDVARRSDRASRSGASSIASRSAACATKPRFADTAARTSARCRGCIIQALRRVAVQDPVLMIDEIDKMSGGGPSGRSDGGDARGARPDRRTTTFVDHYLNLPFDLSRCLFICTANNLFDIPAPLRDRMEIIKIAGYTVEEKVEIAWRYLLPRLLEEHGITRQGHPVHRRVAVVHLEPLLARGGSAQLRAQPRGDHAQARAPQGGGRRRRVGHRRREGRGGPRHSALRGRRSGDRCRRSASSPASRGRRRAATS